MRGALYEICAIYRRWSESARRRATDVRVKRPLIRLRHLVLTGTSWTLTGDIEDGFENTIKLWLVLVWFCSIGSFFPVVGAVVAVGNAGFIGVFQVLWEGAASSRLSIGRQIP